MIIQNAIEHDIDGIIALDRIAVTEETRRQHIREWVRRGCAIISLIDERVVGYAVLDIPFSLTDSYRC